MTDFCTYCNDVHEVLNFGKDFSGKDTLICADRLSDALVKTMPKPDYGAFENVRYKYRKRTPKDTCPRFVYLRSGFRNICERFDA